MIPLKQPPILWIKRPATTCRLSCLKTSSLPNEISDNAETETVSIDEIPVDKRIVDIGALTISNFTRQLEKCRTTVFWNGPMGIYEIPIFSEGTRTIANIIANLNATTIIGGGSTAEIVTEMKLAEKMTFVSTGGGRFAAFSQRQDPARR